MEEFWVISLVWLFYFQLSILNQNYISYNRSCVDNDFSIMCCHHFRILINFINFGNFLLRPLHCTFYLLCLFNDFNKSFAKI